jgi:hypothetical protein
MWCWRRMEKINLIDYAVNEVLHRRNEEKNNLNKKGELTAFVTVCEGTAF